MIQSPVVPPAVGVGSRLSSEATFMRMDRPPGSSVTEAAVMSRFCPAGLRSELPLKKESAVGSVTLSKGSAVRVRVLPAIIDGPPIWRW